MYSLHMGFNCPAAAASQTLKHRATAKQTEHQV